VIRKKKNTMLQACIVTAVMLFASCAALPSALSKQNDAQAAAQNVLNQLTYTDKEVLAYVWTVSAGDNIIDAKQTVYTAPTSGYAVYIDTIPQANLFHPVKYAFYSDAGQLSVFDANSPPRNMNRYTLVDTPFSQFFMSQKNRRAPIPDTIPPAPTGRDNRYAILMNGGYDSGNNHVRYWNDLSNICITLKFVYGFSQENIIVLCSDGTNPAPDQSNGQNSDPDLDGDGLDEIQYSCVLSNVDAVFTNLAANFSGGEKLFIFTTDHGSSVSGWDTDENLWNYEVLHDWHFAELLALFPESTEKLFTLEPCFSGGFLDNAIVPPGPVVGSTAARYDEYSWAMPPDYVYDTYVFHWTAAMKGEDAYGVPVDADANGDGKIDFVEAYNYAVMMDQDQESPQYGDYPAGYGNQVSLWVSNPPPENVTVPSGPSEAVCGRAVTFSTSATEPENEMVYYRFDWGDGNKSDWIGPFNPGTTGSASYAWMNEGVFHVRAKAKDEVGSESSWTAPHNISVHRLPVLAIQGVASTIGKLYVNIKNVGTMNVTDLNWTITFTGGIILLGKKTTGTNGELNVKQAMDLQTKFILGFGRPTINIRLETQGEVFERNATATVLLCFITNMQFE
jgi:hypothetical protein